MTRSVAAQWIEPITTTSPMPLGDQLDAAQDERPHQDLAQLAVGLDERQELLAVELEHLATLNHANVHERRTARQQASFHP